MARRFTATTLASWGVEDHELVDTAVMLVSELVANAVLHARSESRLVWRLVGRRLRAEVHDQSRAEPIAKPYDDDAATGRGIHMVEALADGWGSELARNGKTVWFELALADREMAGRS